MLACWVFTAMHGEVSNPGPRDLLAIAAAITVYSGVNLVVLLTGMYLATAPPSYLALFPAGREIGYEGSKLLLGVLGALLVEQAPLLFPAIPLLAAALHRSSLVRELMTDASTDGKTGLLTPKAWNRAADGELARCLREETPIALMIFDLDHFKLVNDQHGHATGDTVLHAVGALLGTQVRAHDLVGRYGGEEFVVLLPDTTIADAAEIADRIRRRVGQLEPVTGLRVTASVGVTAGGAAQTQISELFASADSALYRAKAAGRDRVMIAA
jgi:diguanylate cyclase (GGDEF)-like protein